MTNLKSPPHSPTDIQSHLYASFLAGKTADVAVHVHGSWEAIYKLHRVVLIQAGFFRDLFEGGFSEAAPRLDSHIVGPSEVKVVFPDPNITRAAFELCIARLYGGGPPLFISPSLTPTQKQPLTSSFPPSLYHQATSSAHTPPGQQPCSPRFILSLLATSLYLSIPTLASQALGLVLSTVGPMTITRYLNFAIGRGIGDVDASDPDTVIGLERVAQIVKANDSPTPRKVDEPHTETTSDVGTVRIAEKEDPAVSLYAASTDTGDDEDDTEENGLSYHYGAVSNKIGEAAACWLTRWGMDILPFEEHNVSPAPQPETSGFFSGGPARQPLGLFTQPIALRVWRRGGLSAEWVVAVIASDVFFVKDEKERYDIARRIVELRRREGGIVEAEEVWWRQLFEDGIYYSCMSHAELMSIAQDVSPTTQRPFVSARIIHASHWDQSALRHEVIAPTSQSSSSPSRSPPPREKQLAIPVTTGDILANVSSDRWDRDQESEKWYYPVSTDTSFIVGDNDTSSDKDPPTMESLFEINNSDSKRTVRSHTAESYFGIKSSRRLASECAASDDSGKGQWSKYQPYRFGVEFWGAETLKERSRLHSRTVWYAGSLWNVYVQVVRKKGVQLGLYLHRQSSVDPAPSPSTYIPQRHLETSTSMSRLISSSPPSSSSPLPSRAHGRGSSLPQQAFRGSTSHVSHMGYSSSGLPIPPPSRSTTPAPVSPTTPTSSHAFFSSGTPPSSFTAPTAVPSATISQPYRDPRQAISAYFSISCASTTGSSLMRFTSSPDVFSISQSWGWKSSSLRTEDYLQVFKEGELPNVDAGREVSLRATVLLGLV